MYCSQRSFLLESIAQNKPSDLKDTTIQNTQSEALGDFFMADSQLLTPAAVKIIRG